MGLSSVAITPWLVLPWLLWRGPVRSSFLHVPTTVPFTFPIVFAFLSFVLFYVCFLENHFLFLLVSILEGHLIHSLGTLFTLTT
jgi:hypothetical protein